MKLTAAIAIVVVLTGSAQGKQTAGRQVTVYLNDGGVAPTEITKQAEIVASDTFHAIGVTIHWRNGRPQAGDSNAIVIELTADTPVAERPGSLAFAYPYEGVHIRIYWDRIQRETAPRLVLGFVMVHEITHILQGLPRHSSDGIMKAHWTAEDKWRIETRGLKFAPEDIDLIYRGLEARATRGPRPASAPQITAAAGFDAR
jgi:hypothetical protein